MIGLATFLARPLVKFGVPVLLLVGAALWFALWLSGVKHDAKQEGVTQERTGALVETVNRMENASDTRRDIANPATRARYDECLRSARTPENCKRFLPQ
ncbi:MAG: hypothetical protein J7498_05570 [Sphingobium sp.]|nr:hypothetical protein [Sphingobium sp.]